LVKERLLQQIREAIRQRQYDNKSQFVILEDVTVGVCDTCGNRYYSADVLHAVHEIASGAKAHERLEEVRVGHAA
jgi:YgiT-type zinc finger domain-containing protein